MMTGLARRHLILAALVALSIFLTAVRPVWAVPICSEALLNATELQAARLGLSLYRPKASPKQLYHVGEPTLDLPKIGAVLRLPQELVEGGFASIEMFRKERLKVTAISADRKFFEFTSPTNIKIYFKITALSPKGPFAARVELKDTPFEVGPAYSEGAGIQNLKNLFDLQSVSVTELAARLSESQMRTSFTARSADASKVAQIEKNIFDMNIQLARKMHRGEELSIADLREWNKLANHGLLDFPKMLEAGIIRGTQGVGLAKDQAYLVDLAQHQMVGKDHSVTGNFITFLPPELVLSRLEKLVTRVNALNATSSLRDVAEIYQDYILIHPFVDGNGRTARALVDYALFKLHLPPLPADAHLPWEALYKSPDELAFEIRAAYGL